MFNLLEEIEFPGHGIAKRIHRMDDSTRTYITTDGAVLQYGFLGWRARFMFTKTEWVPTLEEALESFEKLSKQK